MQLAPQSEKQPAKKPRKFVNLTGALTAASCALLGADALAAQDDDWQFDTALLYYSESDDRVAAVEGIIAGQKDFGDSEILDLKATIDSLTGASATGAVPQPRVQTFTRPSGQGNYQVAAGETPLDHTFRDTRLQLNAQWSQPLNETDNSSIGVHLSKEYDYLSVGFNGSISRDINRKNTTLSAGLAYSHDIIDPEGGRPVAFAAMAKSKDERINDDEFKQTRLSGNGNKDIIDLLIGVTQVINRRMIMQFNYSYSYNDGYLTDPFKLLSLVDQQGLTQNLLFENRPRQRRKQSFYWQSKYHFNQLVTDLSYRYMTDDWAIDSHTTDVKFRYLLNDDRYLEPHLRYYQQDKAHFYRPFLNQGEALPAFASADYRIGEMSAYTVGVKFGMTLPSGNDLALRLEYYQQDPKSGGFMSPGVLSNYDLNPKLKAVILQINYSF